MTKNDQAKLIEQAKEQRIERASDRVLPLVCALIASGNYTRNEMGLERWKRDVIKDGIEILEELDRDFRVLFQDVAKAEKEDDDFCEAVANRAANTSISGEPTVEPSEIYALQWSHSQQSFHCSTLVDCARRNLDAFKHDLRADRITIAVGTAKECNEIRDKCAAVLTKRQSEKSIG